MDANLQTLRSGTALLVCAIPRAMVRLEDGHHGSFAPSEDLISELAQWAAINQIKFVIDEHAPWNNLLLALTPDYNKRGRCVG